MTQIEARKSALVYTARRREDKDDVYVIAGTFFIFTIPYFTLIDISSTHLYKSSIVFVKLDIPVECIAIEYSVIISLGQFMPVDKVFNRVLL